MIIHSSNNELFFISIFSNSIPYNVSSNSFLAPQPPVPGASINPAICSGITGLLVGIGIGIGFGALIFNPYRSGRVGGGIWFGKKRRKRSLMSDDEYDDEFFNEHDKIMGDIGNAKDLYDDIEEDDEYE